MATELPVAALFDVDVVTAQACVDEFVAGLLYPEEREHVATSVPKRQAEFGMARICARRALERLGIAPCSLVPHADRSPRWPDGVVGSITHGAARCAVVLAHSSAAAGLGLDLEADLPLQQELERLVCTPAERRWLEAWPDQERGRWGKVFFSAKEAFYKCQYATTRTYLDFLDVELRVDVDAGTFVIQAIAPRVGGSGVDWELVARARGRWLRAAGVILTSATL
jgi:4'-phosphopantetheinyl transferase EntD